MRAIFPLHFLLPIFLCGSISPTWSQETKTPGTPWISAEPKAHGYTQTELDELTKILEKKGSATGVFVAIGGKKLFEYGNVTELCYIASCRKSVLSILYGIQVDKGVVDLSTTLESLSIDDVGGLLPIEKTATIDHLITARSGVYHPASNGGDDAKHTPERGTKKPGTYMLYNNWDFNAAGAIYEQLTKRNIYDALEEDLAIPLGFEDFDRDQQKKSGDTEKSKFQAYHIFLSTRDMAKIGQLMANQGAWNGKQIVSPGWVKKTTAAVTPKAQMNPESRRSGTYGYGYMWWVWDGADTDPIFEGAFTASGYFGQYITVIPKLDMVVAHKTNPKWEKRTGSNTYRAFLKEIVQRHGN